jgi:hypothetical protein
MYLGAGGDSIEAMGRKSRTQHLTESILGQHLALAVAAHLARTQLIPDPLTPYDGQHMSETIDVVANALARVVPLYVNDPKAGAPRELLDSEREGATIKRGATLVVLRDGRTLSSVSIRRGDLRQAIAILKATGVPELVRRAPPPSAPEPAHDRRAEFSAHLVQLEKLLQPSLPPEHYERCNRLLIAMARGAPHGRIANLAMRLMSAVHDARGSGPEVRVLMARLRAAVQEDENARA